MTRIPDCTWTGCDDEASHDILVRRGRDGTHYVSGPYCYQHALRYQGDGTHQLPGSNETLYLELLRLWD